MFYFIFASFDLTRMVGSRIDDFIHSLRRQNIDLEVDALGTRNGPSAPSYNGAITVTGDDEVCRADALTSKTGGDVRFEQRTPTDTSRWDISHF